MYDHAPYKGLLTHGFTVDGKPVFPEYQDGMHCPADERRWPKSIRGEPIYRSYDFGLTPACVFSQITPEGNWIILDELVSDNMGFDEFSDVVLEHSLRHYRGMDFIDLGDPAGQQRSQTDTKTCFEIGWAKGMQIQAAPQGRRIRLEGTRKPLRTIHRGGPQFVLHPRCKRLRKALLGGYHYRRKHVTGEVYEMEPNKNQHSHIADALTYAGAWLFGSALIQRDMQDDDDRDRRGADRTRSSITGY
jgi:hypothetical protein